MRNALYFSCAGVCDRMDGKTATVSYVEDIPGERAGRRESSFDLVVETPLSGTATGRWIHGEFVASYDDVLFRPETVAAQK